LRECALGSLATVLAEVGCTEDPVGLCAPQFAYWQAPPLRPGTREVLSRLAVPVCVVSDVERATSPPRSPGTGWPSPRS
jgi:2-haloacid dehalogenase/putative hydrolase of the HAD superfamily